MKGEIVNQPQNKKPPVIIVTNGVIKENYPASPKESLADSVINNPGQGLFTFQSNPYPSPISEGSTSSEGFESATPASMAMPFPYQDFGSYPVGNYQELEQRNNNLKYEYPEFENFSDGSGSASGYNYMHDYNSFTGSDSSLNMPVYSSQSPPQDVGMHESRFGHCLTPKSNGQMF